MKFMLMLIRNYVALSLLIAFFTACANKNTHPAEESIISIYEQYAELLNENHQYTDNALNEIFSSYTVRYQNELLNSQEKSPQLLKALVSNYLAFPLLLSEKINHFEKKASDTACLVINGMSAGNDKLALYLTYKKEDYWLIDYVKVEHMAPYNQYLDEANCSKIYLDELRFKEMMAQ